MKVILFQDIVKIGTAGEVKEVANGFARNYLLPRQIAHLATPANLKRWESEKKNRKKFRKGKKPCLRNSKYYIRSLR